MRTVCLTLVLLGGCGGGKDESSDGPTPTDGTTGDTTGTTGATGTDADGDGFASVDAGGDDCDDSNPAVNPDADEICDGIDNDCEGTIDLDPVEPIYYADNDQDGFGDPGDGVGACYTLALRVLDATDCDDGDATVHPGQDEWCNDRDDDCDPATDEQGAISVNGAGKYTTIQQAIDASVNGDTLDVCAGTYQEPLIAAKGLYWVGHGGRDLVFLDGENLAPVLRVTDGTDTHITGITLQNGSGDNGGCLSVTKGDLYLDDARVSLCEAANGGGIYFEGGRIFATGTEVVDNVANIAGGGIYGGFNAEVHLTDCTVDRDTADIGGAAYGLQSTDYLPTDTTFDDDAASTDGGGLALFKGSTLVMSGGSFLRDAAPAGAALLLSDSSFDATAVDMGTGIDDNVPDDVFVLDLATSFSFDGVASPVCDATGCI